MKKHKCDIDVFTRRLAERIDLSCETCFYNREYTGECAECWCDESSYEPIEETKDKLKPVLRSGKTTLEKEDCKTILDILGCGNDIDSSLVGTMNDIYIEASEV